MSGDIYDDPYEWCPDGCLCCPKVERKPRLTITTRPVKFASNEVYWSAFARLDGDIVMTFKYQKTEPEARAAAQAYVDELVKHFRGGGE